MACLLLGVFWVVKYFNQKWLHHHQLESYSKDKEDKDTIYSALAMPLN
jgi:hypothetical protein